MGFYRVMFIGHGPSGLPEDHVVNTFHFATTDGGMDLNDCMLAVRDFYTVPATSPAVANPVGAYLSPWVQRAAELRGYVMTETPPRTPTFLDITLAAPVTPSGLPEEVALCISYHGTPPPAITPRKRGRIYIGPLCTAATQNATDTDPSRPGANFVGVLVNRSEALVNAAVGWAVHSTVDDEYTFITEGYIDNAFDTQRRRGPGATARTTFGP